MSPSAQQSENFPAGWIGDRPEDNLILCPAICNHLVTVTRWLPIVNHAWSRSRCLSSATCGAKHLPRPAQYRSRFATRSAFAAWRLHQLEVACLADRKTARLVGGQQWVSFLGPPVVCHWSAASPGARSKS